MDRFANLRRGAARSFVNTVRQYVVASTVDLRMHILNSYHSFNNLLFVLFKEIHNYKKLQQIVINRNMCGINVTTL